MARSLAAALALFFCLLQSVPPSLLSLTEGAPSVKLSKLGGTDWSKQKNRAKAAAKDLAKGLIALYAERQRRPGFAFSPDSPWQTEFEEAFDYAETDDQLRCIADIKKDMERPVPMDRLLCEIGRAHV